MGPLQVCGLTSPTNMIDLRPKISAADQIATFTSLSLPHHKELTNILLCEHKQNEAGMCSDINPSRNKGIKTLQLTNEIREPLYDEPGVYNPSINHNVFLKPYFKAHQLFIF